MFDSVSSPQISFRLSLKSSVVAAPETTVIFTKHSSLPLSIGYENLNGRNSGLITTPWRNFSIVEVKISPNVQRSIPDTNPFQTNNQLMSGRFKDTFPLG